MPDMNEIKKIVVPIANSYGVKRLYLFGSYAKYCMKSKDTIILKKILDYCRFGLSVSVGYNSAGSAGIENRNR